jgi:dipeptidyl-peptidase-4
MRTLTLLLPVGLLLAAAPLRGDDPKPAKDAPLDTTYLRRHAETRGFMLGRPVKPKPTPDGKAVLFLRAQARVPKLRLYEFDVATGKTRELLTPEAVLKGAEEHLTPEEKARRERQRVSVGGFADFQVSDDSSLILVSLSGKLYVVKRENGAVRELATGEGTILDPKFSPDGKSVAYVRDNDVYVIGVDGGKEQRVTTGGSDKKTHGLAEFVAQEEMSRFTGYWWSPDAKHIAYEEADADGVEVWYVADPISPETPPNPTFYPRPGKANVKVRLGVVPVTGGDTVWLEWDAKKYPYLTDVRWDKKGGLTLAVQTRLQDELVLLRADPATGKTTPLVTEKDAAWVNIHHDTPRWLDDGSFLWTGHDKLGERLEQRDATGELKRVLVPGDSGYMGLVDVDAKAGQVVFEASAEPTEAHLYKLALDGGKPVALTKEPGLHAAVFGKNHEIYVHQESTPGAMPKSTVHRADGALIGELPSVAEEPPFTPKSDTVKVGFDGAGFYAYVVRPHGFDPTKRYPVVLYVYGGPGHQQVQATMNTRLLPQWIADQGFIVVSLDNRGTPGRGRDWEKAISRKFGSVPLEDQVAGLKALGAKYPEMDLDRAGVYGWSFGGYLSALAVLRRPDVFKVGIAGAPVVDWLDYDTHYTERYLGLPETDAAAYKEASLLTYAADLKRPLLLVHGTADDNVYFRHTLKLSNALFREGKEFELLPLPGLTHMVPDPVVMQRLYGRFAQEFQKHLGKPAAQSDR